MAFVFFTNAFELFAEPIDCLENPRTPRFQRPAFAAGVVDEKEGRIATGIAQATPANMDGDPDPLVAEEHRVRVLWWEKDGRGTLPGPAGG